MKIKNKAWKKKQFRLGWRLTISWFEPKTRLDYRPLFGKGPRAPSSLLGEGRPDTRERRKSSRLTQGLLHRTLPTSFEYGRFSALAITLTFSELFLSSNCIGLSGYLRWNYYGIGLMAAQPGFQGFSLHLPISNEGKSLGTRLIDSLEKGRTEHDDRNRNLWLVAKLVSLLWNTLNNKKCAWQ